MTEKLFYESRWGKYFLVFEDGSVAVFHSQPFNNLNFKHPLSESLDPSSGYNTKSLSDMIQYLSMLKAKEQDLYHGPALWYNLEKWIDDMHASGVVLEPMQINADE